MEQFILIILSMLLGQLCRFYPKFPKETAQAINAFVLYISLPAVIIIKVPELIRTLNITLEILIPISMAWLMFIFSYLIFSPLGKKLSWGKKKTGAIILTAGLANTSFVGFPLLEALRGIDSIKIAIINDQLGTFLAFSTLGLLTASMYSEAEGQERTLKDNLIAVLKFPPFITLSLCTLFAFAGLSPPPIVGKVLTPMAKSLGPLALFAVGFGLRINLGVLKDHFKVLSLGITYKLILCPLIFILIYKVILGSHSEMTIITILESAMASMVTASVICYEFELDTEVANLMVGLSIILSLMSVPLWNMLLS